MQLADVDDPAGCGAALLECEVHRADDVEVVVAAEEKFGVSIPDDEVKNLKTVGDAVAFIENAM